MTRSRPAAAIGLFLYKRVEHATQTVAALRANQLARDSDLYVFCDAARDETDRDAVARVRQLARTIDGFKSVRVVERDVNLGIARSIIDGMSAVFQQHERAIVIEDDIVCSPKALLYFSAMLDHFETWPRVSAISANAYPRHTVPIPSSLPHDVYFTPRLNCWGWATWRDRWRAVQWDAPDADEWLARPGRAEAFSRGGGDLLELWKLHRAGRIDSWAIQWEFDQFRRGLVTAHPREPYTRCIGLDGSGTHHSLENESASLHELSVMECWRLPARLSFDRRVLWAHKDRGDRLMGSGRLKRLLSLPAWWVRVARRVEKQRVRGPQRSTP